MTAAVPALAQCAAGRGVSRPGRDDGGTRASHRTCSSSSTARGRSMRRRRARFAAVRTEADLGAAGGTCARRAGHDRRAAHRARAPQRADRGHDSPRRLPDREARLREPARRGTSPRSSTCPSAGGTSRAPGAPGLRPLAGRQGSSRLPGDRRPAGAARLRRPLLGPRGPGRAQPVLGRGRGRSRYNLVCGEHAVLGNLAASPATASAATWSGTACARSTTCSRGRRGRHAASRSPAPAAAASSPLSRRPRRAHRGGGAVLLPHLPAHADGQPDLRGPGQRPRAGPLRPRSRRASTIPACSSSFTRGRSPAAAVKDFFPIEGTRKTFREMPLYGSVRHGRPHRLAEGSRHRLAREPPRRLRVPRPLQRPAGRGRDGRHDPRPHRPPLHALGPGARRPARPLAARGHPRGLAKRTVPP